MDSTTFNFTQRVTAPMLTTLAAGCFEPIGCRVLYYTRASVCVNDELFTDAMCYCRSTLMHIAGYVILLITYNCAFICIRVCPSASVSVSESVRPENLVNTISRKSIKGILHNFDRRCNLVYRCAD